MGWFGRILTFEILADKTPPSVGTVLSDASNGAIASDADETVVGFAAYGRSIKDAVKPLVDCFAVELFDDGIALRPPANVVPFTVRANDLGNSADEKQAPRLQREQLDARAVPADLRLTYYDPQRDFQTAEARAAAGEQSGIEIQQDLPAVLNADDAKSIAQRLLARTWSDRDKLTLRLPPSKLGIVPGSRIEVPLHPSVWRVEKATIDAFVVIAECRPSTLPAGGLAGDSGRIVANSDVVAAPMILALIDVPNVLGLTPDSPAVLLAASATSGWRRQSVDISYGGQSVALEPARSKSVLGRAETSLPPGSVDLIDEQSSVDVGLVDADQWLTSCDDDALVAGENLATLGSELIQFGSVTPLGAGRFRLSRLLRGRGGTEWACSDHSSADLFCLIRPGTLQPVSLPSWSIGATVAATSAAAASVSLEFAAQGVRPPSPVGLMAERQGSGDLLLTWTRRSRQGFAWLNGVDVSLGEASEEYRVTLTAGSTSVQLFTDEPSLTVTAATVAALGSGAVTVDVRQVGDLAVSVPATVILILP